MGNKEGENPVALRAAVFLLSAKNRKGVFKHPPAGRRLKERTVKLKKKIFDPTVFNRKHGDIIGL